LGPVAGKSCRPLQAALTKPDDDRLLRGRLRGDRRCASTGPLSTRRSREPRRARRASGARFTLDENAPAEKAGATRSAASLATLDALLALQGEEHPRDRRRRYASRGTEVLDALDGLKASLLSGRVDPQELRRLADRLANGIAGSGDPALDAVLEHVELRARVELAKLGMS
jgi:hypothetical protein